MREMKQLINLTYSLQGLSLITDLTDGNRVGLRLYLDRHLAISEEEKSRMDFNAYAQKIFSEGKCKFLPHGILVDQGFHMEEVYNGKTFPEYIDRPDETVAVLSLENEAGDKEYLYLPTDISAMDKVKKRLNIAAFAEGIVNGIENIRLPESILPSPEDMCMSLQGDVQKLTLFNEMCQTVSCFDEAKMDRLAMAAGFVGTSEFTDITYIANAEIGIGYCPTITAAAGMAGNNQPILFDNHGPDTRYSGPVKVAQTVTSALGTGGNNTPLAVHGEPYCIAGNVINRQDKNGGNGCGYQQGVSYTLTTEDRHCVAYTDDLQRKKRVRKLIPLECERLMGFPDHWTDIPGASDSVRYRALGNSVAVPCVEYILCGIAYFLERQEGERDVHIPG